MRNLNTIIFLFMTYAVTAQVEFLVEINPETGDWEKIDSITNVNWISTNNASFDPVNKQYSFVGSDPTFTWELISLDVDDAPDPTEIAIASSPLYPDADAGDNMHSMEADQLTGISYALHWDASETTEYVVSVNRITGEYELVCAMPDIEFVYFGAAFNSESKIFTFRGKTADDPWALYSVDVTTGLVVSNPTFPVVEEIFDNINFMQYNADGELFGLHWDASEEMEYFVSIDPTTGEHEIIAAIPDIHLITGGGVFDELNNRYSFLGFDDGASPMYLVTIDAATGEVLFSPEFPILEDDLDNIVELQYDNSTGILYGLHWDNYLICPESYSEISVTACDHYISPSGIYGWSFSGIYTDTLASVSGCDSVITIDLTINDPDITVTIEPDDLISNQDDAIYQWIDCNRDMLPIGGAIDQIFSPEDGGSYAVVVNLGGCLDTSDCIDFCFDSFEEISVLACDPYLSPSGTYEWTETGIYLDTLINMDGCDSIITIDLTIPTIDNTVSSGTYELTSNQAGATYQWLDCNNDMIEIDGATDQIFAPDENGSYAVIVTNGGCSDTSDCFDITALTIEDAGRIVDAIIYPNPTKGDFNIEFSSNYGQKTHVEITDISGKIVYTSEYTSAKVISIHPNIATGIYYIQIEIDNNGALMQEILIIN